MTLEYKVVLAQDDKDNELLSALRDRWQIKEILPPPKDSEFYRFVLVKPKI